jgi:hypothetical protein
MGLLERISIRASRVSGIAQLDAVRKLAEHGTTRPDCTKQARLHTVARNAGQARQHASGPPVSSIPHAIQPGGEGALGKITGVPS